jgi:muramoyltetrapeptide carboxypeptidase
MTAGPTLIPRRLKAGDTVRFVSPASRPDRDIVAMQAGILESWGLNVEVAPHAFDKFHYLAGADEDRLADLNEALGDPQVRAVLATRGGKGSYRIAERMDFEAVRRDPKLLVGFSDITCLHLMLWRKCRVVGIHGALMPDETGVVPSATAGALRSVLFDRETLVLHSRPDEATSALTTAGIAAGPLIGGNLDMIATSAGWALPDLRGAILLLEAVGMYLGQVDRQLTMLRKAGHLDGVAGIAVGQFTRFEPSGALTIVDLLRDHFGSLGVPILGGLPLGHGERPLSVPHGARTVLDAGAGTLTIAPWDGEARPGRRLADQTGAAM